MVKLSPRSTVLGIAILACCLWVGLAAAADSPARTSSLEVHRQGSLVSLVAKDEPLKNILSALAKESDITIYLAKDLQMAPSTCQFDNEPLEKVLQSLLRPYNYFASFGKKGKESIITSLKIYPKGKSSGALEQLNANSPAGKTAKKTAPPAMPQHGVVAPGATAPAAEALTPETVEAASKDPLFALQQTFQQEERKLFEEQTRIKRELGGSNDPERTAALSKALAEQAEKLKNLQEAHTNKVEAVKRLQALNAPKK